MTNETREQLAKVFRANANKQLSLEVVLASSIKAFRSEKYGVDSIYAEIIGEHNSAERSLFMEVFATCMPHVWYNGAKKPSIVDFVEKKENSKADKPFKQYRLPEGKIVSVPNCATEIETTVTVRKEETVTLASGYVLTVPSRDKDGNYLTDDVKKVYIPQNKAVWGYTPVILNAILDALAIIEEGTK